MLVGIVGLSNSGKSTFAKQLLEDGYTEVQIAETVKQIACLMYNLPREKLEDQEFKTKGNLHGNTPRKVLQYLATEIGRGLDKDVWIRRAIDKSKLYENVVLTDVRFPNELLAIQNAGGVVVDIRRDSVEEPLLIIRTLVEMFGINWFTKLICKYLHPKYGHESELWYWILRKGADYVVENNLGIRDLQNEAETFEITWKQK